jgi:hypothetical protein
MGWNSWDAWGYTIDESHFRDTVTWFHNNLQRFSWQYVVIDEAWFAQHPENPTGHQDYTLSDDGRYMPAINRFPSAAGGKGFRPLADWVHSLGLKFGIHIVRGIPREAVSQNLHIAGSHFGAADAADTTDTCRWNADNYGLRNNKAAQAYYDSVADLYAKWGVDYLKVDCISRPWKADEIHMMQHALAQSGRPIVLSLSPGPTPIEAAADAVRSAQLWRISDDMWDLWSKPADAPPFPQAEKNQLALLAKWQPFAGPGHWPDADMLPIGYLGPTPGWGQPRQSRLTHDEVRTMMTLWSISSSALTCSGWIPSPNPPSPTRKSSPSTSIPKTTVPSFKTKTQSSGWLQHPSIAATMSPSSTSLTRHNPSATHGRISASSSATLRCATCGSGRSSAASSASKQPSLPMRRSSINSNTDRAAASAHAPGSALRIQRMWLILQLMRDNQISAIPGQLSPPTCIYTYNNRGYFKRYQPTWLY